MGLLPGLCISDVAGPDAHMHDIPNRYGHVHMHVHYAIQYFHIPCANGSVRVYISSFCERAIGFQERAKTSLQCDRQGSPSTNRG